MFAIEWIQCGPDIGGSGLPCFRNDLSILSSVWKTIQDELRQAGRKNLLKTKREVTWTEELVLLKINVSPSIWAIYYIVAMRRIKQQRYFKKKKKIYYCHQVISWYFCLVWIVCLFLCLFLMWDCSLSTWENLHKWEGGLGTIFWIGPSSH